MEFVNTFYCEINLWYVITLISLVIGILILSWLLIKREKAIQLIKFSLSPAGLKLSFELNTDKKLEILALENLALKQEIKGLKNLNKKANWRALGTLLLLFMILIFDKLKIEKKN